MSHARRAAAGELADANGCIATTFIDESVLFSDTEYASYYDTQGFPVPGRFLAGVSENGASVVVDIDL